ncbi:glucosyltransferase domain-containing protein [Paenibacillus sp. P36]|uniref:glucosyltransferase domain-containing protein n=1 Tax=Paenibacillus sp. P36 TaxID=3342538 RepID=UPI0038B3B8A9
MISNALKARSKYYWVITLFVALLAYGFAIINYTVYPDDEWFFNSPFGILQQGRWGDYLTTRIFDYHIFLPFWRGVIALTLFVISSTIWCYIFQNALRKHFDEKIAIAFTSVFLSFGFMSRYYIYVSTKLSLGMSFFVTPIAVYYTLKYLNDKNNKLLNLFCASFLLAYAVSFSENSMIMFLIGVFIVHFLNKFFDDNSEKTIFKLYLINLLKIFLIVILAIFLWRFIANFLLFVNNIQPSDYTSNMIVYNLSSLSAFINSILVFMQNFVPILVRRASISYIIYNFIFISTFIVLIISIYKSYRLKNVYLLLDGILVIISSFSLILITGNVNYLPERTFIPFGMLCGFAFVLLHILIKGSEFNKTIKRSYFTFAVNFMLVLTVFYQTKEMNEEFVTNYQRYQLDVTVMNNIMHDLGGITIQKPIEFVGILPPYNTRHYEVTGSSIFYLDRAWLTSEELNSNRPYNFINMHGYHIIQAKTNENIIKEQIKGMPNYPNDGYIKDFGDYIIVKLGKSAFDVSE